MVLEVRRRPLDLGQPRRTLHELDHEGDVGDGEAQGLDAGEPLLVGEGGNLRHGGGRVSHGTWITTRSSHSAQFNNYLRPKGIECLVEIEHPSPLPDICRAPLCHRRNSPTLF